uniref:TetR/AcrR family transcriptional regulator n=1 Tax=Arthrobacter sp. TaxID=1667 RepID=UPI000EB63FAF|nr:TetR/AcrR family transcriptional regulator [Arthrobacter sp.]AXV46201.1 transcriptional regulator, TetR family [Arthrobacter sp.]
MASDTRTLRADAERNRQAIICAAGRLFATEGTGVTLERIAGEAGVGVGTIYRRFATVDDLIAVVFEEKMSRYADRTEQVAEQALTEPWPAFRDYVFYILEQQANDIAFSDVILSPNLGTDLFRQHMKRALDASIVLVDRAKDAGAIRPDFEHSDLYLLTTANAGLVRGTRRSALASWRRFGEYMLQAFRCRAEGDPLTQPSPVLMRSHRVRLR